MKLFKPFVLCAVNVESDFLIKLQHHFVEFYEECGVDVGVGEDILLAVRGATDEAPVTEAPSAGLTASNKSIIATGFHVAQVIYGTIAVLADEIRIAVHFVIGVGNDHRRAAPSAGATASA